MFGVYIGSSIIRTQVFHMDSGYIYCGWHHREWRYSNKVLSYDPITDAWNNEQGLQKARCDHTMIDCMARMFAGAVGMDVGAYRQCHVNDDDFRGGPLPEILQYRVDQACSLKDRDQDHFSIFKITSQSSRTLLNLQDHFSIFKITFQSAEFCLFVIGLYITTIELFNQNNGVWTLMKV